MCSSSVPQPLEAVAMAEMGAACQLQMVSGLQQVPARQLEAADSKPRPTVKSPFRGLSWDRKNNGWRVRIYFSGKQRHVGRFDNDVTAAKAYDKAAVYLYGSNAITNFGLEACQNDPTEVSTFIVLAKEQAEQEQLARNQQRQQYSLHNMGSSLQGSYGLPQQQAFLPQQPQQQQLQHQGSITYLTMPGGMSVMPVAAWPSTAGAAGAGAMQGGYTLAPPAGSMAVMPGSMVQHASPVQQQQAAPQMWATMGAGMSPVMHQQQHVGMQAVGPMAGGSYVNSNMAAQYPANSPYMVGQQQGMCVLASPAGPAASSTAMLLALQPHQQAQQQQFFLNPALPCSMPAQHAAGGMAAGFPAGSVSPVSNALSVGSMSLSAQPEMLQQQSPARMTGAEGSHSACGVGGDTFVRDMLHSLNYAAAGHNSSPPGALQQPQQQQQGGVYVPQGLTWVPVEGTHATSSAGTAPTGSWAMAQAPLGSGQAFPAAGGLTTEASPSFSAASSTSASTSTGFALPRMCAASSAACA